MIKISLNSTNLQKIKNGMVTIKFKIFNIEKEINLFVMDKENGPVAQEGIVEGP